MPPPAPAGAVTAELLQAQIAELTQRANQAQQSAEEAGRAAEYWKNKASTSAPTPPPARQADLDDDIDPLEVLTQGASGFDKLAEKRGFVKKADVEKLIDRKATAIQTEQQLLKEYPQLGDQKSEFFSATAMIYAQLVKDGVPEGRAMAIAARETELLHIKEGKIKTPAQQAEDRKAEMRARAAAQDGPHGHRATAETENDELNSDQMRIALSMGITPEAYMARAKSGVQIRGNK